MNQIKIFLVFCIMTLASGGLYAQVEDYGDEEKTPRRAAATSEDDFEYDSENDGKKWDWSKARIGGNLGLAFYSGGILVDASPTFGYKVHKMVEVGAIPTRTSSTARSYTEDSMSGKASFLWRNTKWPIKNPMI